MNGKRINIKLDWSREQSERVLEDYHFEKRDRSLLEGTALAMMAASSPVFFYIRDQELEKEGFLPVLDEDRYVLCCATLGEGIDALQEELEGKQKLMEAYMLECISMELLSDLYEKGRREIENDLKEEAWNVISYDFLEGKEEWVREVIEGLDFPVIYQEGYLIPQKSVVYAARLSKESGQKQCGICETCPGRETCPKKKKGTSSKELLYGYMRIMGGKR